MYDSDSWESGNVWGESCDCPQLTAWRRFLGHSTGWGNTSGAQQCPWVEKMELGSQGDRWSQNSQNRVLERRELHRERTGLLQRVPFEFSAEYWSAQVSEETTQGHGKNHLKGWEETMPRAHARQEMVSVPSARVENLIIHGALSIQKGFASVMGPN